MHLKSKEKTAGEFEAKKKRKKEEIITNFAFITDKINYGVKRYLYEASCT